MTFPDEPVDAPGNRPQPASTKAISSGHKVRVRLGILFAEESVIIVFMGVTLGYLHC